MPTGQQIITRAVTTLNIIDDGGAISASESAGLLIELNAMIDAWATEETLIPSVSTAQYKLTANLNPYYMGPVPAGYAGDALLNASVVIASATNAAAAVLTRVAHGLTTGQVINISGFTLTWLSLNAYLAVTAITADTFSVAIDSTGFGGVTGAPVFQTTPARPVRIDNAVQVSTVGGGTNRNGLTIVGSRKYFEHNDLSASATTSDELYPDYADASGLMALYQYPVPTCPTVTYLELQAWNAVAAFALGVNQTLPPGYEDAIVYALAFRCIPRYGAVINASVAEVVTSIGKQAKDRIKTLNVMNRLLDPSLLPQQQAAPPAGR